MSAIPNKRDNPNGLHQRYIVTKPDEPTDPMATYFVLRLDHFGRDGLHIAASRAAAKAYSDFVARECYESFVRNGEVHHANLKQVAEQLRTLVEDLESMGG